MDGKSNASSSKSATFIPIPLIETTKTSSYSGYSQPYLVIYMSEDEGNHIPINTNCGSAIQFGLPNYRMEQYYVSSSPNRTTVSVEPILAKLNELNIGQYFSDSDTEDHVIGLMGLTAYYSSDNVGSDAITGLASLRVKIIDGVFSSDQSTVSIYFSNSTDPPQVAIHYII